VALRTAAASRQGDDAIEAGRKMVCLVELSRGERRAAELGDRQHGRQAHQAKTELPPGVGTGDIHDANPEQDDAGTARPVVPSRPIPRKRPFFGR
jgi:hypothetical protein